MDKAPTTEELGKESYKSHHFEQPKMTKKEAEQTAREYFTVEQPKCKICNGTGHYTSEKAYEADCVICRPPACNTEQPNQETINVIEKAERGEEIKEAKDVPELLKELNEPV